tara:strand:+ start:770 stop:2011 length:1242 start_codon:yes stop_codon:yes gene_type:complete
MKKLLLFLLLISFISYSQGYRKLTRQGEKAYKENDYATATISSIKALQQKQNFKKSIELFEKSIIRVNRWYETQIDKLESSSIPFNEIKDVESTKYIIQNLQSLIEVQDELMFFPEKVKLNNKDLISNNTKDYSKKLNEAKLRLTDYNLLAAKQIFSSAYELYRSASNKRDYQKAYYRFQNIKNYISNYENTNALIAECLKKGTMRVAILSPANSSGITDTRFNVLNTVVNQIRINIKRNKFITPVNIQNQSIGYYSNNYSGINADLVIKITFNEWNYGDRVVRREKYSNEKTKTKKDGTVKIWKVNGTIIDINYFASYDAIVEAISTKDNTIEKSESIRMDYNDNQGYLLGTGDSRANDSGFRLVSKEEPVSLLPPTFGQFGKSQQFSNSSQELFKSAFVNQVSDLISNWYN